VKEAQIQNVSVALAQRLSGGNIYLEYLAQIPASIFSKPQ
jgi:hypothetical protein